MNCPNCGRQMEIGYLATGGYRLIWTTKARKLTNIAGERDVPLQKMNFTGKNSVQAHICRNCRKLVADY